MNKQELIEKYEKLEGVCKDPGAEIARLIFLEDLQELDESQKVAVPQFVADWLEYSKNTSLSLVRSLMLGNVDFGNYANQKDHPKLIEFFRSGINQELFVRAWLDGYTVEKEPKYTVKVKATKQYLSNDEIGPHFDPSFRSNFTKSDLEKLGLGWVFNCEGMEVEKVGK